MIPTSWWSSLKVRMPVKLLLPSRTQSPGQAASVPGCRRWWRGRACSWGHTAAIRSCEHFGRGVLPSQSPLWDRFRPVGAPAQTSPGPRALYVGEDCGGGLRRGWLHRGARGLGLHWGGDSCGRSHGQFLLFRWCCRLEEKYRTGKGAHPGSSSEGAEHQSLLPRPWPGPPRVSFLSVSAIGCFFLAGKQKADADLSQLFVS